MVKGNGTSKATSGVQGQKVFIDSEGDNLPAGSKNTLQSYTCKTSQRPAVNDVWTLDFSDSGGYSLATKVS